MQESFLRLAHNKRILLPAIHQVISFFLLFLLEKKLIVWSRIWKPNCDTKYHFLNIIDIIDIKNYRHCIIIIFEFCYYGRNDNFRFLYYYLYYCHLYLLLSFVFIIVICIYYCHLYLLLSFVFIIVICIYYCHLYLLLSLMVVLLLLSFFLLLYQLLLLLSLLLILSLLLKLPFRLMLLLFIEAVSIYYLILTNFPHHNIFFSFGPQLWVDWSKTFNFL